MSTINHVQNIIEGKIPNARKEETTKKLGDDSLGKDAFLQLLVAQLKYQDPLNPSQDTEFIAQLASFSQLEALQNLTQSNSTSQAFSLVGKHVVLKFETESGNAMYTVGKVDYVTVEGKDTYLSVNGEAYNIENLYQVVDSNYLSDEIEDPEETEDNQDDQDNDETEEV